MTDNLFGITEKALALSEERAVMISNNIVNISTPHYKARDIDFHGLLQDASDSQAMSLVATSPGHLQPANQNGSSPTLYRVPMKMNMDGNTVDEEIERKNFLQNALNYQVNLTFIKYTSDILTKAIKGE